MLSERTATRALDAEAGVALTVTWVATSTALTQLLRRASLNGSRTVILGQVAQSIEAWAGWFASRELPGPGRALMAKPRSTSATRARSSAAAGVSSTTASGAPVARGCTGVEPAGAGRGVGCSVHPAAATSSTARHHRQPEMAGPLRSLHPCRHGPTRTVRSVANALKTSTSFLPANAAVSWRRLRNLSIVRPGRAAARSVGAHRRGDAGGCLGLDVAMQRRVQRLEHSKPALGEALLGDQEPVSLVQRQCPFG